MIRPPRQGDGADLPAGLGPVPRSRFDYFLRTRDANAAERLADLVLRVAATP